MVGAVSASAIAFRDGCDKLLDLVEDDDPQKGRVRTVLLFLRFLAETHDPRGVAALTWIRDQSILPNHSLERALEIMIDVATTYDDLISVCAFKTAALLLLVSYLFDVWHSTVLVAPQDTLNFKRGTSTIILDGGAEFAITDRQRDPSFLVLRLSSIIDTFTESLGGVRASAWQSVVCDLVTVALDAVASAEDDESSDESDAAVKHADAQ